MTRNEEEWLNSQEKRRRFMAETIQLALDLTEDLSDFDDDDKDDGSHDDQSVEMLQPSKQCFQTMLEDNNNNSHELYSLHCWKT